MGLPSFKFKVTYFLLPHSDCAAFDTISSFIVSDINPSETKSSDV
jgi:hypothetical protein